MRKFSLTSVIAIGDRIREGVLGLLLFIGVVSLMVYLGHEILFKSFKLYDDEGYVLFSLHNFGAGGALYTEIYSQYGPAFYLIADLISRIGNFEWGTSVARIWTLCLWVGTATGAGLLVRLFTRDWCAAIFGLVGTYLFLIVSVSEPVHPGSFIITILMASILGAAWALKNEKWKLLAVIAGVSAALLGLTKINVGAFYVIGILLWMLTQVQSSGPHSDRRNLIAFIAGVLPFFALSGDLADPSVFLLALVSGGGAGLTVLAVYSQDEAKRIQGKTVFLFLGTGVTVTVLVVCLSLIRGTGFADLIEGTVLGPLRHPGVYSFGLPTEAFLFPLLPIVFLAFTILLRRRNHGLYRPVVLLLRLVATLLVLPFFLTPPLLYPDAWVLYLSLPFLLSYSLPISKQSRIGERACGFIGILLFYQILHAYPVAGSQVRWGAFLAFPLLTIGIFDTVRYFQRPVLSIGLAALFLVGSTSIVHRFSKAALFVQDDWIPLSLPGTGNLILPPQSALGLWVLHQNVARNADVLMSFPGLFSFNIWTDVPAPTGKNATHWFSLLDESEQAEIIAEMERSNRPLVIVNHGLIRFLLNKGVPIESELVDYISERYHPVLMLSAHALWVRQDFEGSLIGVLSPTANEKESLTGTLDVPLTDVKELRIFSVFRDRVIETPEILETLTIRRQQGDGMMLTQKSPETGNWSFGTAGPTEINVDGLARYPMPIFIQLADASGRTLGVIYKPAVEKNQVDESTDFPLPGNHDEAYTKREGDPR